MTGNGVLFLHGANERRGRCGFRTACWGLLSLPNAPFVLCPWNRAEALELPPVPRLPRLSPIKLDDANTRRSPIPSGVGLLFHLNVCSRPIF